MTDQPDGYREIEHTADLGIEVEAVDLPGLFASAGEGFYGLIADPETIKEREEISVSVTGEGWEELFHAWLCDLLAQFNLKGFVGRQCEVTTMEFQGVGSPGSKTPDPLSLGRVEAKLKGEILDLKRHRFYTEIKGVTYHEFKVWHENGKWRARVIFDV